MLWVFVDLGPRLGLKIQIAGPSYLTYMDPGDSLQSCTVNTVSCVCTQYDSLFGCIRHVIGI